MCSWRCVAEVLGIDPFDVRAVTGDTDLTPVDLGSYSSRVTLMMGNAAIQAAERAREILADGGRREARECRRIGWCSPTAASSTARIPDRGVTFQEAVCMAEARFGTIGTTGSYTPPKSAGAVQGRRRRAVADLLVHRGGRRSGSRSGDRLDRPCRACGLRTTSAARSTRRWCADRSKAASTWALGEALMEEQAFRRLPPRLSQRAGAQVPVDARVQEPDEPRHAGDLHRPRRASGSGRAVRREGSRTGTAAADHAGGGQRGVRRGRRARRPDSGHAGEDPARAAGEGRRQARALGTGGVSRHRLAGAAAGRAAVGRRRRPRLERAGAHARGARPTPASKPPRGCGHDAPAAASAIARRARVDEAAAWLAEVPRTRCCSPAAPTCCRT